LNISLC